MSDCKNGLFNCITPLPMDASGKMSDYEFLCWVKAKLNEILLKLPEIDNIEEWVNQNIENIINQYYKQNKIGPWLNIVSLGAKNDGITPTGAIINDILSQYRNCTFYFPPGTYLIEETINFSDRARHSIVFDTCTLRQTTPLSPMIYFGYDASGVNYPMNMSGTGLIDMAGLGGVGVQVGNLTAYSTISDIQIRNCSNGTGMIIGDEDAGSMQFAMYSVKIYGVDSKNEGTGLVINGYDCTFDNLYVYLCKTAILINHGGHTFNYVHIWAHTHSFYTDSEFMETIGVNVNAGTSHFNTLYLDSVYTGISTNGYDQSIDYLFYTSDITQAFTTDLTGTVINRGTYERIMVASALLYSPRTYKMRAVSLVNASTINEVINKTTIILSNKIMGTDYDIFSISNNIAVNRGSNLIVQSSPVTKGTHYILGYIKSASDSVTLTYGLKYQHQFKATIRVDNNNEPLILNCNLLWPYTLPGITYSLGEPINVNGVYFIPFIFTTNDTLSYALSYVFCESTGENGFYPVYASSWDNAMTTSEAGTPITPYNYIKECDTTYGFNYLHNNETIDNEFTIEQSLINALSSLTPKRFTIPDKSSIYQYGYNANEVAQAITNAGLTLSNYGFITGESPNYGLKYEGLLTVLLANKLQQTVEEASVVKSGLTVLTNEVITIGNLICANVEIEYPSTGLTANDVLINLPAPSSQIVTSVVAYGNSGNSGVITLVIAENGNVYTIQNYGNEGNYTVVSISLTYIKA